MHKCTHMDRMIITMYDVLCMKCMLSRNLNVCVNSLTLKTRHNVKNNFQEIHSNIHCNIDEDIDKNES